ncbi:ABC transporter substrate-binding protein [Thalassospira sp. MA62]|nr:ABC transporter substrate-binding protein [Thalassospira sp. MA62]
MKSCERTFAVQNWFGHMRKMWCIAGLFGLTAMALPSGPAHSQDGDIVIGLSAAFGHTTTNAPRAIEMGILTAIDEINEAGGVLGGRNLALTTRDDRSIPDRGVRNFGEFSEMENLVAVFGGNFSPVAAELAKQAESQNIVFLDPWAAANTIVPDPAAGSFVFRLSATDDWALARMVEFSRQSGWKRLSVLIPNNEWGRSSIVSAVTHIRKYPDMKIEKVTWYNLGDPGVGLLYASVVGDDIDAVLMVANDSEGAQIVTQALRFPPSERRPIVSHWGIASGDFPELVGPDLGSIDLNLVTTFSFSNRDDAKARDVFERASKIFNLKSPADIPAQPGFAHAYDLTHVLARAIEQAGSLDPDRIRGELEKVQDYDGLTRTFAQVFSPDRHEALSPEDVVIGRFGTTGMIEPLSDEDGRS